VGAVLRQLEKTEIVAFRTIPDELRDYLKDNLDKLRIDADNEMDRDLDLIGKGKRQLLAELIGKIDRDYISEMRRKAEETSSRESNPAHKEALFS